MTVLLSHSAHGSLYLCHPTNSTTETSNILRVSRAAPPATPAAAVLLPRRAPPAPAPASVRPDHQEPVGPARPARHTRPRLIGLAGFLESAAFIGIHGLSFAMELSPTTAWISTTPTATPAADQPCDS